MAETWQLVRSGPGPASWNMALDEALLRHSKRPTLRLYSWTEPAATFGYFQKHSEVSAETRLRPLIRRCTGGGIVPHDRDWTYSLVFPKGAAWYELRAEESYRRVHEWVSASFGALRVETELAVGCELSAPGQCFVGFEKHDVLLGSAKLAGAAQRRSRTGLLIQGSIQPPPGIDREAWERAFIAAAENRFGIRWVEDDARSIGPVAESLDREKYSTDRHNRRR